MSVMPAKNLPTPTPETKPYWDACQNNAFILQQCRDCSQYQFYPRIMCSHCGGQNMRWATASGKGRVESFTIVHRAITKAYAADAPYVVALVRLQEGPCMMTNMIDCDVAEVCIDMPVQVDFKNWSNDLADEFKVPVFRPA